MIQIHTALISIILLGFYLLFEFLKPKVLILLGYKYYNFSRILSHGIKEDYKFFKTEEDAMLYGKNYDFISEIKPNKKRLKPNEN